MKNSNFTKSNFEFYINNLDVINRNTVNAECFEAINVTFIHANILINDETYNLLLNMQLGKKYAIKLSHWSSDESVIHNLFNGDAVLSSKTVKFNSNKFDSLTAELRFQIPKE